MPCGKCWWCAETLVHPSFRGARAISIRACPQACRKRLRMNPPLGADLFAGWTCLRVSQPGFVSLLIRFHFFFLMLPLGLLRKPWLNFVAVQKGSPCRVRTVLTIL